MVNKATRTFGDLDVLIDAFEPLFEVLRKTVEEIISIIGDFMEQFRRAQLLAWLLGCGVPVRPAKWISEKWPKRLLPKFDWTLEEPDA